MSEEKPKLIVDDDWKERVQAEKEAIAKGPPPKPAQAESGDEQIPPASFPFLVSSLATQALMGMGQIPGPDGEQAEIHPPLAKHHIDMLAVLEEKTAGNLSPDEANMLTTALHELRMIFVAVARSPGAKAPE